MIIFPFFPPLSFHSSELLMVVNKNQKDYNKQEVVSLRQKHSPNNLSLFYRNARSGPLMINEGRDDILIDEQGE